MNSQIQEEGGKVICLKAWSKKQCKVKIEAWQRRNVQGKMEKKQARWDDHQKQLGIGKELVGASNWMSDNKLLNSGVFQNEHCPVCEAPVFQTCEQLLTDSTK